MHEESYRVTFCHPFFERVLFVPAWGSGRHPRTQSRLLALWVSVCLCGQTQEAIHLSHQGRKVQPCTLVADGFFFHLFIDSFDQSIAFIENPPWASYGYKDEEKQTWSLHC